MKGKEDAIQIYRPHRMAESASEEVGYTEMQKRIIQEVEQDSKNTEMKRPLYGRLSLFTRFFPEECSGRERKNNLKFVCEILSGKKEVLLLLKEVPEWAKQR